MNRFWLFKMAWRDSRKNRARLFLFLSSIILGIAALVAIQSFGENLKNQLDNEAKELLGADIEIQSRYAFPQKFLGYLDSMGVQSAREVSFASMVLFTKSGESRLVNVRAVEPGYPYYGSFGTNPINQGVLTNPNQALVDETLLLQYKANTGDSVKVGEITFAIRAGLTQIPGQTGIAATVAPPVFIPYNRVEETNLMQRGSRLYYKLYVKYPPNISETLVKSIKDKLEAENLRYDDVEERKEEIGEAYEDLTGFLNLTAFIALLLGCIGVASSVHIYMKEKVQLIALLRCLGAKGRQGFGIYLVQLLAMGLIGSIIGAFLGTVIQYYFPLLFKDFLPFDIDLQLSWPSVIKGIVLGVITTLLFSLYPLLKIRKISPLKVLRASVENNEPDRWPLLVYVLIGLFILGFSYLQLGNWFTSVLFCLVLLVAFVVLAGLAQGIIWLVKRFFPTKRSFILRQSLANLYRPNNQTLVLVITIGLGTALLSTLFLSRQILLDKVNISATLENRPNMVLFDIQESQIKELEDLTKQNNLPVLASIPVVTMQIESVKGKTAQENKADTVSGLRNWVFNREYRVTYRNTLTESETVTSGIWQGKVTGPRDSIFISLDERLAEDLKVAIGDPLVFNVQGAFITTYLGSIRKVDWQRLETNFQVLFPSGVLEQAPKFYVLLTRFESAAESAKYQQVMVQKFPSVSIIDLNLILQTVDEVISKVSFIIQFMAFFSIITGIIVLIGSVLISKYQRIQESVLLRTLGASRNHILSINALEYFILGSLAALTGIVISLFIGMGLAIGYFNTTFNPDLLSLLGMYLFITLSTVFIGLYNYRSVIIQPPLEILRKEG